MAGPHHHTHLHPHHKPKHLESHHVTIDGTGTKSYATPLQYEHAVLHQLRRMHHSRTGQAVFHEFEKRSHHFMKIIPYEQAQINAFASAKDPLHATRKGLAERSGADGHVLLDNHGFEHLTTDTDAKFLPKRDMTDYRYRLVYKLVHDEPRMVHELRNIHCPFNPIRRYYELQRTHVHVH